MSFVVLYQASIEKLAAVATAVEIRDERGTLVGYFHPAATPNTADPYECPLSDEELRRRASTKGGRPLADILSDLRSRIS